MTDVDEGCGTLDQGRKGDWIQTFTGRQYWPLDPRADEVSATDIAHHLSMLCRFTGACNRFYSVAEHSVLVMRVVALMPQIRNLPAVERRTVKLLALLHDAPEAYCNDIARPVKRSITGYAEIEALNDAAIREHFGLPDNAAAHGFIKQADNAMLLAEQGALMRKAPREWAPIDLPATVRRNAMVRLNDNGPGLSPAEAEHQFDRELRYLLT